MWKPESRFGIGFIKTKPNRPQIVKPKVGFPWHYLKTEKYDDLGNKKLLEQVNKVIARLILILPFSMNRWVRAESPESWPNFVTNKLNNGLIIIIIIITNCNATLIVFKEDCRAAVVSSTTSFIFIHYLLNGNSRTTWRRQWETNSSKR